MIAAMSANRVIGINNDLPWHLPDDMKYFMETTSGSTVVMGRKNYQSIPDKFRPLPNRTNLVITRQPNFKAYGCIVKTSMAEALHYAESQNDERVFIIGGGQIYKLAIDLVDTIYLTEIHTEIKDGEVFFPAVNGDWQEVSRIPHEKDERHAFAFDFVTYKRVYL